jgi:hypothetical protein
MTRAKRTRAGQAFGLTAAVIVLLLGVGGMLGTTAAFLAAITMPVPLVLLWLSTDVYRADE